MPIVDGTVLDFTTTVIPGMRVAYWPSGPVVFNPGLVGYILDPKPIYMPVAADGTFSGNLFENATGMPDSWYDVTLERLDPHAFVVNRGFVVHAEIPGKLRVPAGGGPLADLLATPWNPTLGWYGPEAPEGDPVASTLWIDTDSAHVDLLIWSD
jgi:hypothetical protein